jgi:hypothetical protein
LEDLQADAMRVLVERLTDLGRASITAYRLTVEKMVI